jgi:hydrogenase maturation protease
MSGVLNVVEFLDGGTLGMALLSHISGRRALLVLDAVKLGAASGTIHVLREWDLAMPHGMTAHESNAAEVLGVSALLGECPKSVRIIGIEPDRVSIGIGLSVSVRNALVGALDAARRAIQEMIS